MMILILLSAERLRTTRSSGEWAIKPTVGQEVRNEAVMLAYALIYSGG